MSKLIGVRLGGDYLKMLTVLKRHFKHNTSEEIRRSINKLYVKTLEKGSKNEI